MHAMHGDTFVHSLAISQSILLLEKFYGLIFIRLSETTTEEMMCLGAASDGKEPTVVCLAAIERAHNKHK